MDKNKTAFLGYALFNVIVGVVFVFAMWITRTNLATDAFITDLYRSMAIVGQYALYVFMLLFIAFSVVVYIGIIKQGEIRATKARTTFNIWLLGSVITIIASIILVILVFG